MSNVFIKPADRVTFKFVTGQSPSNALFVVAADDEAALRKAVPDITGIENHEVTLRFPSYKDNAQALDDSIDISSGTFQFKTTMLRLYRLTRLTAAWSFKDEKGEPVPVTAEAVGDLHPVVAAYLGGKMEEIFGIL